MKKCTLIRLSLEWLLLILVFKKCKHILKVGRGYKRRTEIQTIKAAIYTNNNVPKELVKEESNFIPRNATGILKRSNWL